MRNLFVIIVVLLTAFSAQAQVSGMHVAIAGASTGTPISATVAVTSSYNGFGVPCANSSTGTNNNGVVQVAVTGGSANFTYKLYTGSAVTATALDSATVSATSKNFTGLLGKVGAGQAYTATVQDANGCVASIAAPTKSVIAPDTLKAGLSSMVADLCQSNNGSIVVTASGGVINGTTSGATSALGAGNGYDVTWTAGTYTNGFAGPGTGTPAGTALNIATSGGTQSYTGLSGNTTYTFVVTDDNGCVVQ